MRKATIYILIIEILFFLLGGCAKPVKPVISKNVLTIDKIYSTTGYAKDVFITDNTIYAAQDETGIILFDRESGNILGEMNNDEIKYITLSEEDSVCRHRKGNSPRSAVLRVFYRIPCRSWGLFYPNMLHFRELLFYYAREQYYCKYREPGDR